METRKIIIVDSATNSKVTINTDATTFGELKSAARAAGINYENKDWLEGLTKTTPVGDDSLLPVNVEFRGQVTNDLVYMLTNTNKHIKSGVMSRTDLLHAIKDAGLVEYINKKYNTNYTRIKTDILVEELNAFKSTNTAVNEEDSFKEKYNNLVYGVAYMLIAINDSVRADINNAYSELVGKVCSSCPTEIQISDKDIEDLFN